MLRKVAFTRQGSYVRRFHTKQVVGEQNLGHHLFGVASLLVILHPNPSAVLLKAVLWHDMAEQVIGDVPSPILRAEPEYGTVYDKIEAEVLLKRLGVNLDHLSAEERGWLWALDKLECLLFSREQVALGNRHFLATCNILYEWFEKSDNIPHAVRLLVDNLRTLSPEESLMEVLG